MVQSPGRYQFDDHQCKEYESYSSMNELLKHYESQIRLVKAVIDAAHDAVVVVDPDGLVIFTNAAGTDLLNSSRIVTQIESRLRLKNFQHHRKVLGAIKLAIDKGDPSEFVLELISESQLEKWWVTVLPLNQQTAVLVVFHNSSAKPHGIEEFLRQGYGLKPAEIRLAQSMALGFTPEEYAESSGLKISTIRTQLRSIFAKTDTKRQSDLVRLMSDVPRVRRQVIEKTISKKSESEEIDQPTISMLTKRLQCMSVMEKITQISLKFQNMEDVLAGILELVREQFDADRSGLLYPCDPEAPSWTSIMESTKPEWITPVPVGTKTPVEADVQELFRCALQANEPIYFDPTSTYKMSDRLAQKYTMKSQMVLAVRPRLGKPWLFGMTHCSHEHIYSVDERDLLKSIGERLTDMLSVLISTKQLSGSEHRFKEIFYNSDCCFLHAKANGRPIILNSALCTLLGYNSVTHFLESVSDVFSEIFSCKSTGLELRETSLKSDNWVKIDTQLQHMDGSGVRAMVAIRMARWEDEDSYYFEFSKA